MAKIGALIRGVKSENHTKKGTLLLFPTGSFRFIHTHPTSGNPSSPPPETTRANPQILPRKHRNLGPNDIQEAEALLNRMTQMLPFPPISQITKALGCITRMGNYVTALSHFGKLHLLGIEVDQYPLNIAINCYCHLNRVDFGFSLLGGLFKRGYTPNVVTFNTLINGLIIEDRTAEAMELFKKLVRNRDIEPDVAMYGTIINGLCKTGNTITAIRLLRIMEEGSCKEGSCKPDTVMYSTIIDSLCKDGMVDDAVSLLLEMKDRGILANVITYTPLIHGLCNFGKSKEATRMFREMLNTGIYPDVCTFNVLVDAHSKEGKAKEAEEVLEVMIERGVDPDVVTYNSLMDGYCLQGQMDEAVRVFNKMADKGVQPNIRSHTILINGYCKKMKIDEAMHLFREMPRKGLKPTVETFNTVLQGLFRVGRCAAAHRLFDEMQVEGLLDEAKEFFVEMEQKGCFPNGCTYNVIIRGFLAWKKYSEALVLHKEMVAKGFSADASTVSWIVNLKSTEGQDPALQEVIKWVMSKD